MAWAPGTTEQAPVPPWSVSDGIDVIDAPVSIKIASRYLMLR
jgi:hypothetical protein